MTAILLVGLPGSGKAQLANKLKEESKIAGYARLILHDNISTKFESASLGLDAIGKYDIVITDPGLCRSYYHQALVNKLKLLGFSVVTFYFENDPIKCLANARARNGSQEVKNLIEKLSEVYNPPQPTLSVYSET